MKRNRVRNKDIIFKGCGVRRSHGIRTHSFPARRSPTLLTGGVPTAPPLVPPPSRDRAEIQPGHSSFEQVLEGAPEMLENVNLLQIGRASCRERVCQYV